MEPSLLQICYQNNTSHVNKQVSSSSRTFCKQIDCNDELVTRHDRMCVEDEFRETQDLNTDKYKYKPTHWLSQKHIITLCGLLKISCLTYYTKTGMTSTSTMRHALRHIHTLSMSCLHLLSTSSDHTVFICGVNMWHELHNSNTEVSFNYILHLLSSYWKQVFKKKLKICFK